MEHAFICHLTFSFCGGESVEFPDMEVYGIYLIWQHWIAYREWIEGEKGDEVLEVGVEFRACPANIALIIHAIKKLHLQCEPSASKLNWVTCTLAYPFRIGCV